MQRIGGAGNCAAETVFWLQTGLENAQIGSGYRQQDRLVAKVPKFLKIFVRKTLHIWFEPGTMRARPG